jgi:hypothetical protein
MATTTRNPGTANASAKTAADKPAAAAKTARPKPAPRAQTPRAAAAAEAKPKEAKGATESKETKTAAASKSSGHAITVTIPVTVDQLVTAAVGATAAAARLQTTVVRRAVGARYGLPVYLGIGGLAVVGVAEWPAAAAAGVGYAVLRRWGPLRREAAPAEGTAEKAKTAPVAEEVKIDDEAESAS